MTDAQTILRMIETVSPDDTAKLDEIDARVWAYRHDGEFIRMDTDDDGGTFMVWRKDGMFKDFKAWPELDPEYFVTTSRDALKAIRPEGWDFRAYGFSNKKAAFDFEKSGVTLLSGVLETEELAELHAVIQAIEYEREK